MTKDPVSRRAARTATLVALPVALLAGLLSAWALGGLGHSRPTATTPTGTPALGATAAVTLPVPSLAVTPAGLCRLLISRLPDRVLSLARRPIDGAVESSAAYGDPPLVLSCGVAPRSVAPIADVYPISGVCWISELAADGTVWTTVDRTVAVSIAVPGPSDGSAQWIAPLSPTVGGVMPIATSAPTGCTG